MKKDATAVVIDRCVHPAKEFSKSEASTKSALGENENDSLSVFEPFECVGTGDGKSELDTPVGTKVEGALAARYAPSGKKLSEQSGEMSSGSKQSHLGGTSK
eukprot:CAMPEP_0183324912 /NCGR_PEP_ID=MMETSP0160_2-20130417/78341_1 /TAXON_ID=2839 ORGANISM="Odontella Sinensis, Strain Grunow 1884" /NCGR_SAMPLE_ID=MMETSP0160_2 /ASSEMBLY_ACC=CAM_ASM_000250 /LENGTH=101 /DNA_ID=CAMNT_0025492605 /DNA_START=101 /DNA_END=406 /DNA_ORIENTATION=-